MKKLVLLVWGIFSVQSALAYNFYTHKYCKEAKRETLFYTTMNHSYPDPAKMYYDFFQDYFLKRQAVAEELILCFQNKGKGCQKQYQLVHGFVRENYDLMKVALMVIADSEKIKHLLGDDDRYLKISQSQRAAFFEIRKQYQISRKGNIAGTRKQIQQKRTIRKQLIANFQEEYLGILSSWPYFRFIDQIDILDDKQIDLAVIDGSMRQLQLMRFAQMQILNEETEIFKTKTMVDFFMENSFGFNFQLCDFVEDIYQETRKNRRNYLLGITLAPLSTAIGACFLLTPVGCVVTGVAIGGTATGFDIYWHQDKMNDQELIADLDINTATDVFDAQDSRNTSIKYSPLLLLEVVVGMRILRLLK